MRVEVLNLIQFKVRRSRQASWCYDPVPLSHFHWGFILRTQFWLNCSSAGDCSPPKKIFCTQNTLFVLFREITVQFAQKKIHENKPKNHRHNAYNTVSLYPVIICDSSLKSNYLAVSVTNSTCLVVGFNPLFVGAEKFMKTHGDLNVKKRLQVRHTYKRLD